MVYDILVCSSYFYVAPFFFHLISKSDIFFTFKGKKKKMVQMFNTLQPGKKAVKENASSDHKDMRYKLA